MASVMGYAAKPFDTNKGMDNVVMSTASASDYRRGPPPPGAAKIRRTDKPLFVRLNVITWFPSGENVLAP